MITLDELKALQAMAGYGEDGAREAVLAALDHGGTGLMPRFCQTVFGQRMLETPEVRGAYRPAYGWRWRKGFIDWMIEQPEVRNQ